MTASLRLIAAVEGRTALLSDADRHEIQVSGIRCFPMNEWRNAILYFLFGMWGNKNNVTYRPKINFGGVSLRLDLVTGKYYAYGTAPDTEPLTFTGRELVTVDDKSEVEVSLIRFVKNEDIKRLTIVFPNQMMLRIWKKERRGEYGCAATGLPTSM